MKKTLLDHWIRHQDKPLPTELTGEFCRVWLLFRNEISICVDIVLTVTPTKHTNNKGVRVGRHTREVWTALQNYLDSSAESRTISELHDFAMKAINFSISWSVIGNCLKKCKSYTPPIRMDDARFFVHNRRTFSPEEKSELVELLSFIEEKCCGELSTGSALEIIREYVAVAWPTSSFRASSRWWYQFKRENGIKSSVVVQV